MTPASPGRRPHRLPAGSGQGDSSRERSAGIPCGRGVRAPAASACERSRSEPQPEHTSRISGRPAVASANPCKMRSEPFQRQSWREGTKTSGPSFSPSSWRRSSSCWPGTNFSVSRTKGTKAARSASPRRLANGKNRGSERRTRSERCSPCRCSRATARSSRLAVDAGACSAPAKEGWSRNGAIVMSPP